MFTLGASAANTRANQQNRTKQNKTENPTIKESRHALCDGLFRGVNNHTHKARTKRNENANMPPRMANSDVTFSALPHEPPLRSLAEATIPTNFVHNTIHFN
eukprot:scaffold4986_cov98-Skeletonema_marinoi.AAC.3